MGMQLGNDRVLDEITAAVERDVQAAAERARRRDEFAKAALTGLLADGKPSHLPNKLAHDAVGLADAMLAALDAAPSVPPSPATRPGEVE